MNGISVLVHRSGRCGFLVPLACSVLCATAVEVAPAPGEPEATAGPYPEISSRNVFALRPIPPPPSPEEAKPPPSKITLAGIARVAGRKLAMLKTPPPASKPGEPPKTEQSYMLTINQREDGIQVLEIDEVAGSVKVDNAGTIETLTFEKNGPKLPAAPAPGVVPGLPPGINPGQPGAPRNIALPNRIPRVPGAPGAGGFPGGASQPGTMTINPNGAQAVPGANLNESLLQPGGPGADAAGAANAEEVQAAAERSPEESVLLYEANRLKNEQLRASGVRVPPMPRHVLLGGQGAPAGQ